MTDVADMLSTALTWHSAGYSVIPIKPDGSKQPAVDWKAYQTSQPAATDVLAWGQSFSGMGVACGGPMNLEMLEVEGYALDTVPLAARLLADNGLGDVWDRLNGGYVERSPRRGMHWYYRVTGGPARGNTKLARRPGATPGTVDVLWETRGQGGQSIIAPSGGPTSRDGDWIVLRGTVADIPVLTVDERDQMFAVLNMLDEMPVAEPAPAAPVLSGVLTAPTSDGLRPGDDYNNRATWDEILTPRGWTKVRPMGSGWTWRRPGKTDPGISATTGQATDGADRLYVFSTSTEFDEGRPYSKFAAYAHLDHGGDMSAAAKALRALGYGSQPQPKPAAAAAHEPPPVAAPDAEDALFDATDILRELRTAARSRLISPTALLGAVLARCVAEVHPDVALPPIIGTRASLNLYVALVGPSGAAKTTAGGVADDWLHIDSPKARVQGTGSGEGLIASYLRRDPDAAENHSDPYVLRDDPNVCVLIDEIGMLGSIQGRNGSTLAPVLRSGWSGSALETINADPSRKRIVPKMSYRLTVIAGVQPLAADVLFDDADTGTPQRWIWLPALDPRMPDEEPEWPGVRHWSPPSFHGFPYPHTMPVPEHVRDSIRAAHRARHRGTDTNHLDGHLALTRLKVAAALTILHGSYIITDQMWDLAGLVMDISTEVRNSCQRALSEEAAKRAERRGRMDHAREVGRAEAVVETVDRDARQIWRVIARHAGDEAGANRKHPAGAGCTARCVTAALTRRTAQQKAEALAHAVAMQWVEQSDGRLSPGSSQPADVTP